ncbi:MAG: DUF424 family protein [Candidatus Bathyarchaeota archaeon]|jgi:hypothetical protein
MRKYGHHVLFAACDADLLGRVLREGKIVFEVREEFYKGPKMSVDEAIDLVEKSTVVNMIGNCIVQKAIEKGLIHPEAVLNISGILHAQIVKM